MIKAAGYMEKFAQHAGGYGWTQKTTSCIHGKENGHYYDATLGT